jgi:hypothetical protein
MEHGSGARACGELLPFARLIVGEEDDVARIDDDALAQKDARRRVAGARGRRNDHRIGIRLRTARGGLPEPLLEQRHRIGRQRLG